MGPSLFKGPFVGQFSLLNSAEKALKKDPLRKRKAPIAQLNKALGTNLIKDISNQHFGYQALSLLRSTPKLARTQHFGQAVPASFTAMLILLRYTGLQFSCKQVAQTIYYSIPFKQQSSFFQ